MRRFIPLPSTPSESLLQSNVCHVLLLVPLLLLLISYYKKFIVTTVIRSVTEEHACYLQLDPSSLLLEPTFVSRLLVCSSPVENMALVLAVVSRCHASAYYVFTPVTTPQHHYAVQRLLYKVDSQDSSAVASHMATPPLQYWGCYHTTWLCRCSCRHTVKQSPADILSDTPGNVVGPRGSFLCLQPSNGHTLVTT